MFEQQRKNREEVEALEMVRDPRDFAKEVFVSKLISMWEVIHLAEVRA